jgi:hypothetical protein
MCVCAVCASIAALKTWPAVKTLLLLLLLLLLCVQLSIVRKRVAVPSKRDVASVIKSAKRAALSSEDPAAEVQWARELL